jgi:tight adherence protein B
MTAAFVGALLLAAWLIVRPARGPVRRARIALGLSALAGVRVRRNGQPATTDRGGFGLARRRRREAFVSLTVVVQQLAALLKGGRSPSRLWDELWQLYVEQGSADDDPRRPRLSPGSAAVLSAARGAALRGAPVAEAIRSACSPSRHGAGGREPRIWAELAACFEIAAASGCPLAEVLTRFAAQLETEDDAEAARQTALAGPKATVALLTWLPLLGLGLGVCLGVDPLAMLLGTPFGVAALVAGIGLTVAGRIWSARLVRAAAGAALP